MRELLTYLYFFSLVVIELALFIICLIFMGLFIFLGRDWFFKHRRSHEGIGANGNDRKCMTMESNPGET